MNGYLYETHMHTTPCSACGRSRGRDYIARYMDMGYSGIIITDNFYHGNCGIDRKLPWKEFIHQFCSGYEDAKNEGDRLGFPVFFGWEENFGGDEYLIYGLDESWMAAHPEMVSWSRLDQYRAIREAGGCVVQAHPFRARSYIHTIHLSTGCADGIEAVNTSNKPEWNSLALEYGKKLGLPLTAGSDNHYADGMNKENLAGVLLPRPLKTIHDFVDIILNKEPFEFVAPESSLPKLNLDYIELPIDIRNEKDESISGDIRNFLINGTL